MDKILRVALVSSLALTLIFTLGVGMADANPYAKYKGTTIVVNWPAHGHYDAVISSGVIKEFEKISGITVDHH